jgi:hypothetical protein
MKSSAAISVEEVLDYLRKLGVLLETDRAFPSITGIIVREPIKGSWWSHPMANDIYMLSQRLVHHPDVIFLKLLSGKATYLHRRLRPELMAIGTAQEPWQLDGLSTSAKEMLKRVEDRGILRMDEIKGARTAKEKGCRRASPRIAAPGVRRRRSHRLGCARQADRDLGALGMAHGISHASVADSRSSEGRILAHRRGAQRAV